MIGYSEERLANDRDDALRRWLAKPEVQTLITVIEAKLAIHQVRAVTAAVDMKDVPESPEQGELAIRKLQEGQILAAQRYQIFLDVLKETIQQEDPFTLTRLSC